MRFPKKETQDNNLFFRLKDGETKTGILRGDLYEFFIVWTDKKSTVVPQGTEHAKSRYRINILVNENGQTTAKIWELSQTVCNQLADIHEMLGDDIQKTKIKISRRGSGMNDTEYSIIPLIKEPLLPKQVQAIEQIPLQILDHKTEKIQPPKDDFPEDFGTPSAGDIDVSDIPF